MKKEKMLIVIKPQNGDFKCRYGVTEDIADEVKNTDKHIIISHLDHIQLYKKIEWYTDDSLLDEVGEIQAAFWLLQALYDYDLISEVRSIHQASADDFNMKFRDLMDKYPEDIFEKYDFHWTVFEEDDMLNVVKDLLEKENQIVLEELFKNMDKKTYLSEEYLTA